MAHAPRHAHARLDARRGGQPARMRVALVINAAMLAAAGRGRHPHRLARAARGRRATCSRTSARSRSACSRRGSRAAAPTPARTFGLQRSEVLGALLNGVALVVISVLILVGAVARLSDPPEVAGAGVLALGLVGLAGNVAATWILASRRARATSTSRACCATRPRRAQLARRRRRRRRRAHRPAGTRPTRSSSILIAALIAAGSWRLLKEPVDVLMEAAPAGIDVAEIGSAMAAEPDVLEVHDLHVWTVTSGFPALSAHVVVRRGCDRDACARERRAPARRRFGIDHTTLQVVEGAARRPDRGSRRRQDAAIAGPRSLKRAAAD